MENHLQIKRLKMTKRKMKIIVNLYKDGVSSEVCIAIIIDLLNGIHSEKRYNSLEIGTYIHMFYNESNMVIQKIL
jgi:hypothetical protein